MTSSRNPSFRSSRVPLLAWVLAPARGHGAARPRPPRRKSATTSSPMLGKATRLRPEARHARAGEAPLRHRQRLSALPLFRRGGRADRLQCRSRQGHLRGAGGRVRGQGRRLGARSSPISIEARPTRQSPRSASARSRSRRRTSPRAITPRRPASSPRRTNALKDIRPETLEGKKVGVAKGTGHEAYLKLFFPDVGHRLVRQRRGRAEGAEERRDRFRVRRRHRPDLLAERRDQRRLLRVSRRSLSRLRNFSARASASP